jgi:bacterial/archaeal transporter family-2 protein
MEAFYIVLVLIAGACAPTQAGINSQLVTLWAKDPAIAALISFAVGTLALLAFVVVVRVPVPAVTTAAQLPWWIWTGGFMGAFLVAVTVAAVPELGAATMIGFMITGQMLTSVVLDHWGLVGYSVHPVSVPRIVGAVLLISGVILIKKF